MTWNVVGNSWQYTSIYGADGKRLFLMDLEDWGVDEDNQEEMEKKQAEIALLASLAPTMLEALIEALPMLEDNARFLRDIQASPAQIVRAFGAAASVKEAIDRAEGKK